MKPLFGKVNCPWFIIVCLAAILAIVLCNLYLLCCGHCVVGDFLRVPAIGWFIIAANLVAAVVLVVVRRRTVPKLSGDVCAGCQVSLRSTWQYCPNCGCARPAA